MRYVTHVKKPNHSGSAHWAPVPSVYSNVIRNKLFEHDQMKVRRVNDSLTIPPAVGTLREEKPYVHRLPYCEHTC
jgi:hypothetical protein